MSDILSTLFSQIQQTTPIEWIATVSGFLCVWLAAKQHIWNWPISMVSVICYIWIFYENKLYGDTILQFYFLGTAIYGWYYWQKNEASDDKPIRSLRPIEVGIAAGTIIIVGLLFGYLLSKNTDTDVPYIDGLCTAMSLTAQFLMTRKILQNWIFWVIVDLLYIPLYFHKNLALTALLYLLFAIIAFKGYCDWKKEYRAAISCREL